MKNDDLVAKCSPRGWGDIVWTGFYAKYSPPAPGETPKPDTIKTPAMAYVMEHHTSTKRHYRLIYEIQITNLYCGTGKGWDIVVCGSIVGHEDWKTDAQREAEKLLDGFR